jgi:acetate---CoA ligase (ADP-forming)
MNQRSGSRPRQAIDRLLRPRSVAIVGASPTPGAFGAGVLSNLENAGYTGELYLINPKHNDIGGRPCISSIDELPDGVDCAVLAIPRTGVMTAVEACVRRKIGGIVIFSAGFAEADEQGRIEQEELRRIVLSHDVIIEGPNCLGIANYVDGIALTFVVTPMKKFEQGPGVAVVSQSGAMAAVLGVSLRHHGLTISYSVSTGNEAAIGVEDFLAYMIDDNNTRVIAMIVEQFRNPRRFLKLVEQAGREGKSIVLLHPGTSIAARASAATHTGALAGDYQLMRAEVAHAGVLAVDTLEELVDVTNILSRCPSLPDGGPVVFTESGAYKALTLDLCERLGLTLPVPSAETTNELRAVLPDFIPATNPLDITAQGLTDPDLYRRCVPPMLADAKCGSLVLAIILTDERTSGLKLPPIIEALREIRPTKPVLFAGLDEGAKIDPHYISQLGELNVPFFPTSERAFRALAQVTRYAAHKQRCSGESTIVARRLALPFGTLPEYKSKPVLAEAGVRVPAGALATSSADAQNIAARIGYPVVLKAQAAQLTHKSDCGGVALKLNDADAVREAWESMQASIAHALPELQLDGIMVEAMSKPGLELIVGAHRDPEWGAVILLGLGGIMAEILGDTRLIVPGLTHEAIVSELLQLKSAAVLSGFRGSPKLDIGAAAGVIERLAALIKANPSIRELDINPLIVYPEGEGAIALDCLMVVEPNLDETRT